MKDLEKEKEEQKEKENKLIDDIILLIDYKNNVPYIKDINGFKQSLIDYYGKEEFDKKFKDKKPSKILDILKEDLEKSTKEVTPELKKIGFDDQKLQNLKDEKIKQEILEELEKQDSTKFFKLLKDNGIIKEIPEDERLKDEIKNKIKLGLVIKKLEDTSKIYQNEKFSNLFQSAWEGNIDNNTYLKSIKTEIDKQAGIQNQNDTKLSQSTVGSNYQGLSTLTPENPIAKLEIGKGIFAKVEKINDTNYLIKGIGNEPIKCNNLEQVDKVLDIGDYLNKLGLGFMIPHINRITNEIEKKQKHDGEKFDLTDGFGDKEKILFLKIVGNIIFDTKNSYFNENKTIDYKLPDFKNIQTLEDIEKIFLNCGQGLGGLKKVKEIIEDQGYIQFGLFNIIPFLEAIK